MFKVKYIQTSTIIILLSLKIFMNTDHCCIVDNSYIREEAAECCTLFHCNGIEFTHDTD